MWSFTLFMGLIEVVPEGETRLGIILDSVESLAGILSDNDNYSCTCSPISL